MMVRSEEEYARWRQSYLDAGWIKSLEPQPSVWCGCGCSFMVDECPFQYRQHEAEELAYYREYKKMKGIFSMEINHATPPEGTRFAIVDTNNELVSWARDETEASRLADATGGTIKEISPESTLIPVIDR